MAPVILLTATVNIASDRTMYQTKPEDRKKIYVEAIRQWLYKTSLNIVVVENSGYTFEEFEKEKVTMKGRFEVISFKESQLPDVDFLAKVNSKGSREIFAINYAYENSRLIRDCTFLIKITARYFIPDLEKYLWQFDLTQWEVLRQYITYHCEMIGCRKDLFYKLFNKYAVDSFGNLYHDLIENAYFYRISKFFTKVIVCPAFPIQPTQRGGVNEMYTCI